jgi:hypothetical protein
MLICIRLRLIASHPSMIRSSAILCSICTGSSAANIAAGLGNASIPGMASAPAGSFAGSGGAPDRASVGITAPLAEPGIGIANGFHIFCMKASASCADSGGAELPCLSDSSTMSLLLRAMR